jgi:hypothetical protein
MEAATEEAPQMAHDVDDEFSQLWQRHLTVLRDDFSATSVQALPSLPSGSWSFDDDDRGREAAHTWDEKMDSVVEALDELTLFVRRSLRTEAGKGADVTQTKPQHHRHSQSRNAMVSRSRWIHRDCALFAIVFQLAEATGFPPDSSGAPSPNRRLLRDALSGDQRQRSCSHKRDMAGPPHPVPPPKTAPLGSPSHPSYSHQLLDNNSGGHRNSHRNSKDHGPLSLHRNAETAPNSSARPDPDLGRPTPSRQSRHLERHGPRHRDAAQHPQAPRLPRAVPVHSD